MGDDSEWMKLPADQKVEHKAWKARVSGYEELTKSFAAAGDEKAPIFSNYQGIVRKFVTDSNAIAQEKAMDAVIAYMENASSNMIGRIAADVCSGLVTKCLNASRARTKEKGIEVFMLIIEAEKQEFAQEELIKGLSNKQPKVVVGCIQTLREAMVGFGPKVIAAKPLMKLTPKLLEDRDKNVREETKQLIVAIYRWIGPAIKAQLTGLKPVQLSELEAEFANLPGGTPKQSRFLRSQQDLKAKIEAAGEEGEEEEGEGGEEGEEDGGVVMDAYDMADPVNILAKLPADFYDKIEAKKWQERKEVLEVVQKLTENLKLESGDYHDLVKVLKKVVAKDSNVMLVTIAAKCLAGLATGLRKKFANHALGVVDVVLEKFKEKKATVVEALRQCIDATFLTTTLDVVAESCVAALDHKTPTVKAQTADFLARCFCRSTPTTLPKKLLKMFVAPLLKTINDTSPEVREASYKALGTAMKVVSEKHLQPFLADVDGIKMAKIKECCESAELIGKSGKPKAAAAVVKKPAAAAKPTAAAAKPAAAGKPGPAKKTVTGGPPKKKAAAKGKKGAGAKDDVPSENFLSDEAVEEKAAAALPADCIAGLANAVWKERLAAMEKFCDIVKGMSRDEIPCQVFIRTIAKKPGLKETNFQVMKLKVELVAYLAKNSKFTRTSAECCLNELVDKIGDVKNGAAVHEALSCIAEAVGLEHASLQVTNYAFEQKNPKNQSESLVWLAQAIREFGFKVNVKPMLGSIKKALAHTNPAVRGAGVSVIGVLHLYMGATARVFFEDEKAALLQQIDAEIEKNAGSKPPPATRGRSGQAGGAEPEEEEEDAEEADDEGGVNVADLVPRNDISDKITDTVISELSDTQWKVRAKALQDVATVLNEAKFITPNIGELPTALNTRLKKDSNKILVTTTLNICTTLATAMGPNIKRHVQTMGPGILNCCGDAKPQLRATAVGCLNAWVEQAKLHPFIENEILSDALKMENPNLRTELFGWLAEKLPDMKKLPAELKDCLPYLYAGLEDRNAGVRQKAADAIMPFMIHVRYEPMLKAAQKVKAAMSKEVIMAALEKAKTNLPVKPTKQKSPPKATAAVQEEENEADDAEEDADEKPAAAAKAPAKAKGKAKPGAKKPASASSKKKVEEEDTGPPLKANKSKEQRMKDEKQLKVLKWNFMQPTPEFKEQLRIQVEPNMSKTLFDQLFHDDFKKHLLAIDTLDKELTSSTEAVVCQLDLILKWMTLRFFDTNTSVLLKILDFLQALFNALAEQDYHLLELEASSFVPYLVNKVGDPKDNVRKSIRTIFKSICKVYPASKMFSFLIEGLKSKNAKQRAECLEELGLLIDFYGINVCHPSPAQALKLMAGQIGNRDNSVRTAALNSIVVAYNILGDTVYKYIGKLNDKDMGMLEERIKRSGKVRPATAPAGGDRSSPEEKPKVARVAPNQNRPATGETRRPMGIARPRKARREFALEIDDNEDDDGDPDLQLVTHDGLDELLNTTVALPETRATVGSPSSVPTRGVASTNDTKSAIDLVISQVASTDVLTTIQALAQIDEVMKDSDKCALLGGHVDQLLVMCSLKLRMTHGRHLAEGDNTALEEALQCYRSLLATVISIFQSKSLCARPTIDVMKDLFFNLFTVLLDGRLEEVDDGLQVIRSVNVTVVKVVDKGDPTVVLGSLMKLLQEYASNDTASAKQLELIMKCLWKFCRALPNVINELDTDRALMHVHHFMKAHPSHSWAQRASDMPLRTVKTIVHTITKLKGAKVMSHLSLIDQSNSELEMYLRKVLKSTGVDLTAINAQNEQFNGTSPSRASNGVELRNARRDSNKSTSKRLSKSTHDMLAEIFKKIGSKENTREGLNDLYDFKQKYPDADLDPFLKKSSQFFQNYIERGLKNIALERDEKSKPAAEQTTIPHSKSAHSLGGSSSLSTTSSGDDVNTNVYMERLKVLRARCGLDNQPTGDPGLSRPMSTGSIGTMLGAGSAVDILKGQASGSNSSISSASSVDVPQLGSGISKSSSKDDTSENAAPSAANVADLKKRLERIKMAARK